MNVYRSVYTRLPSISSSLRAGVLALALALPLGRHGVAGVPASEEAAEAHAVATDGVPRNLGLGLESLVREHQNMLVEHKTFEAAGRPVTEAKSEADLAAIEAKYPHAQVDKKGRVLVNVYLDGTKKLARVIKRLTKNSSKVIAQTDAYRSGVVSAYMPLAEAIATSSMPGVRAIQLAPRPYFNATAVGGLVRSQGYTVLRADKTGLDGTGSTIGALSDTFNLLPTGQNPQGVPDTAEVDATNDDLPGAGNPHGYTTPVDVLLDVAEGVPTDEGRGMLQIVHDMAPAAHLAFATAEGTELVFANNIKALGAPNNAMVPVMNPTGGTTNRLGGGCNIICDDVGYLDEPMFSDGIVAQAIDYVADHDGVSYFSSAGNDGNSGYSGTFSYVSPTAGVALAMNSNNYVDLDYTTNSRGKVNSGVDPALYSGGFHSFGKDSNGNDIIAQNVTTGSLAVTLVFQWDDPYDQTVAAMAGAPTGPIGITTDYNILVFDGGGKPAAGTTNGEYEPTLSGTSNNFSTNQPVEIPSTTLAANTTYRIVLCRTNVTNGSVPQQATHLRYAAPSDGGGFSGDFIGFDSVETYGHNCASNCSGVAAYVYDAIPNINKAANHVATPLVEPFSSNGPVAIYFDALGNRLATPNQRRQPAFATVDGVDTSFFPATTGYVATPGAPTVPLPPFPVTPPVEPIIGGNNPQDYDSDTFPNFFGTSAAAPHAAGCASLIIQAAAAANLPVPDSRYIRSLLQATTQGQIDTVPSFCEAVDANKIVTFDAQGDVSTDPNTFKVTYAAPGSTYQLTSLTINIGAAELEFDTDATTGFPFTQGNVGTTGPGGANGALLDATAANALPDDQTSATLNFTGFSPGDVVTFGVDRDVVGINAYGNGVDQLQGSTFSATLTDTAAIPGPPMTVTGVFANVYNKEYNFKAGYGLVDVNAAINLMLGK